MNLRNKKVLITGGPTWVPLDAVRVISNTSTGLTGILLAEALRKRKAQVTLILGPWWQKAVPAGVEVKRFRFFDELEKEFTTELKKKFDIIVHSAAVSDYTPEKPTSRKISSDMSKWVIKLVRTPKLIHMIKRINPLCIAIGFKYEIDTTREKLVSRATHLLKHSRLDYVIANTIAENKKYRAYIVGHDTVTEMIPSKQILVNQLVKTLEKL